MIVSEKMLDFLLRATGLVMASAMVFVFCPLAWMDSIHQMLGLGPLPTGPVTEYLARTESALYAYLGAMLFFVSFDLPRYRPLLRFLAWVGVFFSIGVTVLDAKLGLPAFWIAGEGPFILLLCVVLLILTRDTPPQ
ncbi:MAG: hypothetical protein FJ263_11655 [Planctomycetes bacterium]|nr:hypothetical protein [Planctomycetota bacterium]